MALHTELSIHKAAADLLLYASKMTLNLRRDIKFGLGATIRAECTAILVLVARANGAQDKVPHLARLIERNDTVQCLLRTLKEMREIDVNLHAKGIELTNSVGRQAGAWKRKCRIPA